MQDILCLLLFHCSTSVKIWPHLFVVCGCPCPLVQGWEQLLAVSHLCVLIYVLCLCLYLYVCVFICVCVCVCRKVTGWVMRICISFWLTCVDHLQFWGGWDLSRVPEHPRPTPLQHSQCYSTFTSLLYMVSFSLICRLGEFVYEFVLCIFFLHLS